MNVVRVGGNGYFLHPPAHQIEFFIMRSSFTLKCLVFSQNILGFVHSNFILTVLTMHYSIYLNGFYSMIFYSSRKVKMPEINIGRTKEIEKIPKVSMNLPLIEILYMPMSIYIYIYT